MNAPAADRAWALTANPAVADALAGPIADALIARINADPNLVEVLADALAARLTEHPQRKDRELVDAAQLAQILGTTRAYVYHHADDLGGIRLGDGPRARLRFDPDQARARLAAADPARHGSAEPTATPATRPARRHAARKPGAVLSIRPLTEGTTR